jgi:hypothetical protein
MIEDSAKELLTALSGEGSFVVPSPRRRGMGASLASNTTTQWMEDALAALAMMIVPPRMVVAWLETGLSSERCTTHHEGR